ncbi:hypothetical protein H5410_011357 [Solanum commersonii]|uniref:Uncharacterized protein n=1 Tax=Solanum commersonii TaxID=4109 RepID=A0A9J6APF6_SOLCO|nr:hypothetical protein H5410_011357 [Solanum commersonii]
MAKLVLLLSSSFRLPIFTDCYVFLLVIYDNVDGEVPYRDLRVAHIERMYAPYNALFGWIIKYGKIFYLHRLSEINKSHNYE